ncbi:Uncharacterized protein SCF082_LOCUS3110 [Durusdinium trenchii]|uniref:Uncharacterized protein n=1 Tax=Durusdinium trenchii TaxID=1381693 RepID=A0ABP0HRK3_9DINO
MDEYVTILKAVRGDGGALSLHDARMRLEEAERYGAFSGGEGLEVGMETERWLDAVAKAVKEGWDGLQIQQAVADVVAEDPVGCARFMETTHRPTQAVHYHDKMIQGAFSAMWSTYPRIPQEDPWADNVPKVDCEVVCPGQGVVMTSSGLALRGEPVEGL